MTTAALLLVLLAPLPPETNRMQPDHAPTPFSAAEIRKGCPDGRMNTFRIERPQQDPVLSIQRFFDGSKETVSVEMYKTTPEGKLIGKKTMARFPWKQLQRHASFEKKKTTITEGKLKTAVGEFECWIYKVTTAAEGKPTYVTTFHFAKQLAGPPVRMVQQKDGKTLLTMTLEKLVKGGQEAPEKKQ